MSQTITWRGCKTLTLDNARQFGAPFYTSESSPTPNASSDQLEATDLNNPTKTLRIKLDSRPRGDLLPCRSDANDGGDTPSFVTCLKCSAHDVNL